jgi:hypothetical protein
MSPGRFFFFSLLSLVVAAMGIWLQIAPWRVGVFTVMGCLGCVWVAFVKLRRILNPNMGEKVGDKLVEFVVKNVPSDGYFWAGSKLPFPEACKHFITVGSTGTGKSVTLKLLMQSVFHRFSIDDLVKRRALVYDSKTDLVGFLAGVLPLQRIVILNPFDARFTPWDIASDIRTETDAIEFASIVIPKNEKESSPYFSDSARALIAGVINCFNARSPNVWTFRDLILAFESTERLKGILKHPRTRHLQDHFRPENDKNYGGVKSTVDTALSLYRPIAAMFASATASPISLREWVEKDGNVLVMGNHESAREATDTLNRLIFRQLSKFIIGRSGTVKDDETWIFLDELREMGVLSGLRQLLLRGRSKGVAVAMGFQDVEGIYATYGKHEGLELIGAAQNAAILHINATAPGTAQWASEVFSSRRDTVQSSSVNVGETFTTGTSTQLQLVPNVFPIMFTTLPMPIDGKPVHYYGFTNALGSGHGCYEWEWLHQHGPHGIDTQSTSDFLCRPEAEHDTLQRWKEGDLKRLSLEDVVALDEEPHEAQGEKPLRAKKFGVDASELMD